MLKYIFKITSGSFFRTLGRILCYLLIGIIIIFFSNYLNILNVHAEESYLQFLYNRDYTMSEYVYFTNCTSNNNCWNSVGQTTYFKSDEDTWSGAVSPTINTIANSYGAGMVIQVSSGFVKDNWYTVTILLYNRAGTPIGKTTNSQHVGTGEGPARAASLNNTVAAESIHTSANFVLCDTVCMYNGAERVSLMTYTFKAPASGKYLFVNFTTTTTVTSEFVFYGYVYTDHGYKAPSADDIKNALNSSFNKVNSNINNSTNSINNNINNSTESINNNIDEMKQKQQETNDYLMDNTPPNSDISSLGNVQGLLPPGPVDSLLNIPFKFLSILTSSMGGVCKPMSGDFYGDTTLTLPCFNEVFWDKEELSSQMINYLSLIPAAFILIKYFKHLYKKVDRAVSMETTSDDEWGVI